MIIMWAARIQFRAGARGMFSSVSRIDLLCDSLNLQPDGHREFFAGV